MRPSQGITLALQDDEDELLDLLRDVHAESGMGEFSEAQARLAIEVGLRREMAMIGVIRGRGGLEGSVGLFMTKPTAFSREAVLSDLWLYVLPKFRRSDRAKLLIGFAKWAAECLDKPLMMTALSNEQTARKVELFERQLPKAGTVFLYRPGEAEAA